MLTASSQQQNTLALRHERALLQLEVDVDGVGVAGAEAGGEGVDAGDAVEGGEDGLIHEGIAAGTDDFGAGDGAVAFDLDFYGADEGFVLLKDGGGLLPLAEEAVVDEFVIPSEFAGGAACSTFAGAAGRRASTAAGGSGFCCTSGRRLALSG